MSHPERTHSFTKAALDEFVEETLAILANLKGSPGRAPPGKSLLDRVEIGLHTIKGNAAAFGFQELASTASRLLDGVRMKAAAAKGSFDLRGVMEFVERAEQYLDRVKDGDVPPAGFFDSRGAPRVPGGSSPANGELPRAPAPSWEKDVDEILAAAPAVNPRLDVFTKAVTDVSAKTPPAPEREDPRPQRQSKPPAPPPLRAAPREEAAARDPGEIEKSLAAGAAGYAFEAALAYETVRTLALQYKTEPRLTSLAGDLSEFLKSFVKWGVESRATPLINYVKEALEWAEGFAAAAGRQLRSEITGTNGSVLPGVGNLLRELVKEVFRALLPAADRGGGPALAAKAALHSTPGYCTIRLSGLTNSQRTSSRLQLYAIQERVEKMGVIVTQGERGHEVLIDVPDNLNSLEVLVLEAGGSFIGVPWHRVIAVEETRKLEAALKGDGWLETGGEKIPIVDLTREFRAGAPGADVSSIVILRSEGRKHGTRVNKVLERREMPVQVASHADWQSDVIGLCISPSDFRCMPLLRWSLR